MRAIVRLLGIIRQRNSTLAISVILQWYSLTRWPRTATLTWSLNCRHLDEQRKKEAKKERLARGVGSTGDGLRPPRARQQQPTSWKLTTYSSGHPPTCRPFSCAGYAFFIYGVLIPPNPLFPNYSDTDFSSNVRVKARYIIVKG